MAFRMAVCTNRSNGRVAGRSREAGADRDLPEGESSFGWRGGAWGADRDAGGRRPGWTGVTSKLHPAARWRSLGVPLDEMRWLNGSGRHVREVVWRCWHSVVEPRPKNLNAEISGFRLGGRSLEIAQTIAFRYRRDSLPRRWHIRLMRWQRAGSSASDLKWWVK